ncbi:MAG TPA: gluconokinase [Chitinophagaceae bacterium]|nr:gluconokinase [Chitinophagaceae bacterium]
MQSSYIIGIDIGTGSAKAVAINHSGEILTSSQVHYSMLDMPAGFSEQNPETIWDAFVNCLKEIVNKLQHVPVAVSLSSCMHSLMVTDKSNLPVTNLILWGDTRSEKIANEIRESQNAEAIYRETGTPIHSMSPLCKIIWLKTNAPEVFSNADKFISIKEFIWFRLFRAYQVDQSVASATGLFNIGTYGWNYNSLQLCGIDTDHLSEIVPTHFIRNDLNNTIAGILNIPANTQFCIGASDGCLANLGSFAMERGTAAITIGTSGAVRIANATPVINFGAMIFNYVLDTKTFICGGPVNNGGNVFDWMMKSFLQIQEPGEKEYNEFFKRVDEVPSGSKGLLFLPYLYGERAPIWDEQSCGVFFGIKSYHNQSYFLRAALEGLCYALKNILQIVEQSTEPIKQLNVSGGFIHSKTWVQILADVTGKKICLVQTEDASAIGAGLLCVKAIHLVENFSSLQPLRNATIEPIENNYLAHEKYFPVFKNLYMKLKESMHMINSIAM